jgi:lipid-binding SYLF domain-containing protein
LLPCLTGILLAILPLFSEVASASDQIKDGDRSGNCGLVLKEILAVPEKVPQDLLDRADCVVVFPSVLKVAFILVWLSARLCSYERDRQSGRKTNYSRDGSD